MKRIRNITAALFITTLVVSIQSCHIGVGIGIGSAKDKKSAQEKEGLAKKTNDTDTTRTSGPSIVK